MIAILFFALILEANASAQKSVRGSQTTISLGLVSEINQKEIENHFRPFADYVGRRLSYDTARVLIAPTALQLAKLLEEKKVDFYMESPYPTYVINKQGAAVLLLRRWKNGMAEYHSLIITKNGGKISALKDLRGNLIAFEDPGSTSGYFLPKVFLLNKRFKLTERSRPGAQVAANEIGYIFAGSDRKVVDSVISQQTAAGAISDDDYSHLDGKQRAEITILAQTEPFPRHLVSTRKDLDPKVKDRLKEVLLSMNQDNEGRKILQQTDNTTKFDLLPGGEEMVRRKLQELFRPR